MFMCEVSEAETAPVDILPCMHITVHPNVVSGGVAFGADQTDEPSTIHHYHQFQAI